MFSATGRRHFYEVLFHAYDKHIKPEEGKAASVSHQLILNRIVDFVSGFLSQTCIKAKQILFFGM